MNSVGASGHERFAAAVNLDDYYKPYPMQAKFHASPRKHRLLGGAAGPGKTLGLIVDHMIAACEFSDPIEAVQVHTLLLRRTVPKLENTLVARFLEKIPKELYSAYNNTTKQVTWPNGSTTRFGSMQYEHNAYDWQGQWYKIGYDELGEFTFKQWSTPSAWNRCPVSPWATKDGASNPIGVGAGWIKSLFIDKEPCLEMEDNQRKNYVPEDYEYFPCTYLDNPVYANDPVFLANLENYPKAERDALKYAIWGLAGGYFSGAWDEAINVYPADSCELKPWWPRWISGDWGFEHWAANYWHCIDDFGVIRTFHEYVTRQEPPEKLAESIVQETLNLHKASGDFKAPEYSAFYYSHDAFHQRTDANTIAIRMGKVLSQAGLPQPSNAGTDRVGRGQLMYQLLVKRVQLGEDEMGHAIEVPAWQIADSCKRLIRAIPLAPRDEIKREEMAKFEGDDPIDGAGHGLYGKMGRPAEKPFEVRLAEKLRGVPLEGTGKFIKHVQLLKEERENNHGAVQIGPKPRRRH